MTTVWRYIVVNLTYKGGLTMKNKLFSILFKRNKANVSGSIIYGRQREINVALGNQARKVDGSVKNEISLSTLFMGIKGLNANERIVHTDRVSAIRRSQREAVQSRSIDLARATCRRFFEN